MLNLPAASLLGGGSVLFTTVTFQSRYFPRLRKYLGWAECRLAGSRRPRAALAGWCGLESRVAGVGSGGGLQQDRAGLRSIVVPGEDYSGTAAASVGTPALQPLPAIVIVASGEMETLPWPAPTISPANMYSTCNHTVSPWDSRDAIFQPNMLLHFYDNFNVILLAILIKKNISD